ncbi:GNAT family N-acetyltransferase [Chryseobacterium sp. LC2016-29]|uniref:GNAT family N-acetyltransferase n=1 Tax=Chryseobacterium sp. LC2016-29 TaxID=2897331 RepID=UPI001E3A6095|nr:GNAT family N-acetyltransferase [Chryseobacterium sp. LC2016-29]MCD0479397.1 GNAT family N-acetyltransferase [Chryseobacterium sp. LC2016-29]
MNFPPYDKFPEIDSETIILREIQDDDIKDVVEISFYDAMPALTVEKAKEMQNRINQDYQNGSSIHWGIANKQTNQIMGTLGYYRGFDNRIGELGCVLKPEFHGKGFMTTAMKMAAEFGLNNIGLTKVIAITDRQNNSAIKLFNRVGFVKTRDLEENEIEYQFVNK